MQLQNDFQLQNEYECTYSKVWPDIWASLSRKQGRVLSQVLAGHLLTGRTPTRIDAEALADYMNSKIDEVEFAKRVGRGVPDPKKQPAARRARGQWTCNNNDDEL